MQRYLITFQQLGSFHNIIKCSSETVTGCYSDKLGTRQNNRITSMHRKQARKHYLVQMRTTYAYSISLKHVGLGLPIIEVHTRFRVIIVQVKSLIKHILIIFT